MPIDRRAADVDWSVREENGAVPTWERVSIAVLMDIRRELRKLNAVLACPNFTAIPHTLREIQANTKKPKRKTAKTKTGGGGR